MSSASLQLQEIFNEPNYAWELLEWEMAIEMNESLSGQAIAHLLELYMRGVEKMNSLMDIRQSYFKNKVTMLMMKNTVVKTLNKPPMAKKQKPLESILKTNGKTSLKARGQPKVSKRPQKSTAAELTIPSINNFALQQKRKEMEMRLAYEAETSSRQNLNNLYNQHLRKEESYKSKVKGLINDHEEQLKQRINKRKLKTATYRSPPPLDNTDTFQPEQENHQHRKTEDEPYSPRQHHQQEQKVKVKRYHSLGAKPAFGEQIKSPRRPRKKTHDFDKGVDPEEREKQIQELRRALNEIKGKKKMEDLEMVIIQENPSVSLEQQQWQKFKEYRQSV